MAKQNFDLKVLAEKEMLAKNLEPEFPWEVLDQLTAILEPAAPEETCTDETQLLWCSIDNDDSRDLDQLTYAEKMPNNSNIAIWIAVADVDALVTKNSPIDQHAQVNTTSVYTPAKIFPMLPEKLSTDLTSLNEGQNRLALVVKIVIDSSGEALESSIYQAVVCNKAKLTYKEIGAWLEETSEIPEKVKQISGLENTLKLQHETAQLLKKQRHRQGALTLSSSDVEAKVTPNHTVTIELPQSNFADELIEHFMIAANNAIANKLKNEKIYSLRRIVRRPKRWERIVEVAAELKEQLPLEPDSKALDAFLIKRKQIDPEGFADLSLVIIKLLGRGEYIVENAGDVAVGHFGLALMEYTHFTAPNRRYPDLLTHRQIKASLQKKDSPYTLQELEILADHCTKQEDAATKVERHMNKVAAALLLSDKIGTLFDGIITGVNEQGVWARIFSPPVEGKILNSPKRIDVGHRVKLELISVDVAKGFINFSCVRSA